MKNTLFKIYHKIKNKVNNELWPRALTDTWLIQQMTSCVLLARNAFFILYYFVQNLRKCIITAVIKSIKQTNLSKLFRIYSGYVVLLRTQEDQHFETLEELNTRIKTILKLVSSNYRKQIITNFSGDVVYLSPQIANILEISSFNFFYSHG